MSGFKSKEEAEKFGYVAAQIRRISDGSILFMNPDETYSFKDTQMATPYKYSLDMLLNSKFETLGWVKKHNSKIMRELQITDYIDETVGGFITLVDNDLAFGGLRSVFKYVVKKLDEKFDYTFNWHYPPFEKDINVVSTYSDDKLLTIYMYRNDIPVDSYKVNLEALLRELKVNSIIDED
jgi:hypothetical protein